MPPLDLNKLREELTAQWGDHITEQDTLSAALYPEVFTEFQEFRREYGPVCKLDTKTFLVGPDIADEVEVSS
jgi:pyruvate carboxylase